jgi:hypothetical protein
LLSSKVILFALQALAGIESECQDLHIGFHVLVGPSPADNLVKWMDKFKVANIIILGGDEFREIAGLGTQIFL